MNADNIKKEDIVLSLAYYCMGGMAFLCWGIFGGMMAFAIDGNQLTETLPAWLIFIALFISSFVVLLKLSEAGYKS